MGSRSVAQALLLPLMLPDLTNGARQHHDVSGRHIERGGGVCLCFRCRSRRRGAWGGGRSGSSGGLNTSGGWGASGVLNTSSAPPAERRDEGTYKHAPRAGCRPRQPWYRYLLHLCQPCSDDQKYLVSPMSQHSQRIPARLTRQNSRKSLTVNRWSKNDLPPFMTTSTTARELSDRFISTTPRGNYFPPL